MAVLSLPVVVLTFTCCAADKSPVPFPNPLITEVLAAVPSGIAGDASGDGQRDAIGDEFIELVNPHDRPINLKGYVLMDSDAYSPGSPGQSPPPASGQAGSAAPGSAAPGGKPQNGQPPGGKPRDNKRADVRFVFPDVTLQPGQVAVVFNGYKQKFAGEVGTTERAAKPNPRFHGAYVFTIASESPYAALSNEADFVLLTASDGTPVQCVKWGKTDKNPPAAVLVLDEAPISVGSVQRTSVAGSLVPHKELSGDLKGTLFSPGMFDVNAQSSGAPGSSAPSAPPAPQSGGSSAGGGTSARPSTGKPGATNR